jgi:hypothetical protein
MKIFYIIIHFFGNFEIDVFMVFEYVAGVFALHFQFERLALPQKIRAI